MKVTKFMDLPVLRAIEVHALNDLVHYMIGPITPDQITDSILKGQLCHAK